MPCHCLASESTAIVSKCYCLALLNALLLFRQSLRCCLVSLNRQICQLTSCNDCYGRQRDQLSCENEQLKARTRDLEKEVCRVKNAVECLKQKVRHTHQQFKKHTNTHTHSYTHIHTHTDTDTHTHTHTHSCAHKQSRPSP